MLYSSNSKTFNILGTLCLIMTGALLLSVQPQTQQVQAADAKATVLYNEYKEIARFPQTQQVKQKQLAQNKLGQYTVASGDTVVGICLQLNTDCDQLKSLNDLQYPYALKTGQTVLYQL